MSDVDGLGQFEQALRRVLWELREYLADVVVIGGWVPYLYKRYGGFPDWQSEVSRTADVDVLVQLSLIAGYRPTLADLLVNAGFKPQEGFGEAAIWFRNDASGEVLEFLVPHAGTAKQLGKITPLREHAGVGAISLSDLEVLQEQTQELRIPVTLAGGQVEYLLVRVPRLGAFLCNKAATFHKRRQRLVAGSQGGSVPNTKRAKDLLYIRDLMAAGPEVVNRIRQDLEEIRQSPAGRMKVDYAAGHVLLLLKGSDQALLEEAAAMLAERDGLEIEEAVADTKGYLADSHALLSGRYP